jgi:hypothetical protein
MTLIFALQFMAQNATILMDAENPAELPDEN